LPVAVQVGGPQQPDEQPGMPAGEFLGDELAVLVLIELAEHPPNVGTDRLLRGRQGRQRHDPAHQDDCDDRENTHVWRPCEVR
jgi:hypothetical protein